MPSFQVRGTVSSDIFASVLGQKPCSERLIRRFRDYLEDQIESEYGYTVMLDTSDVLPSDFKVAGGKETLAIEKELIDFRAMCLRDFLSKFDIADLL